MLERGMMSPCLSRLGAGGRLPEPFRARRQARCGGLAGKVSGEQVNSSSTRFFHNMLKSGCRTNITQFGGRLRKQMPRLGPVGWPGVPRRRRPVAFKSDKKALRHGGVDLLFDITAAVFRVEQQAAKREIAGARSYSYAMDSSLLSVFV